MATTVPATAQGDSIYVGANLFVPDDPEDDKGGDFSAEIKPASGQICYALEVYGLTEVTAAHIHEGRKGKVGPPVVTLQLLGEDGDDICAEADAELLKRIGRRPSDFYVNVHTTRAPAGAVRGQLEA